MEVVDAAVKVSGEESRRGLEAGFEDVAGELVALDEAVESAGRVVGVE
jgi:hypothetical protein